MFGHFMAEKLGFATPRHWLTGCDGPVYPDEVTYWTAYYKIIGEERRRSREPAKHLNPEEMLGTFRGWMTAHNAGLGIVN